MGVYSTKNRLSEFPLPPPPSSSPQTLTRFLPLTSEVFDVETNEKVNDTYGKMQMPSVEKKLIVIDDYSRWGCSPSP